MFCIINVKRFMGFMEILFFVGHLFVKLWTVLFIPFRVFIYNDDGMRVPSEGVTSNVVSQNFTTIRQPYELFNISFVKIT